MDTYLRGPMGYAKTLKLLFGVGDLDLPQTRKRYTRSRVDGEVDAQNGSCVMARESINRPVGECEIYREERHVFEEGSQ